MLEEEADYWMLKTIWMVVPINAENKKMILFSIHLRLLLQEQM